MWSFSDGPRASVRQMNRPMPELEGVSHEFVDVKGLRIHVATAGAATAEPLILLHGWPQHWWAWRRLIGPLAEHYRVICPDLPGFGWSAAPPGRYLKAELADDIIALADALGIERFRLAGHDWGGLVGFHICRKQPERVSHYAAAGISHLWVRVEDAGIGDRLGLLARLWYQFLIASPVLGRLVIQRLPAFTKQVLRMGAARPGTFSEADLETFAAQWSEPDRSRACVALYRSFLTREFSEIAKGAFRDDVVGQPVLILVGDRDPVIRANSLAGAEHNLPNAEIRELPGVGHWVPEEAPEQMLASMLALYER